MPGELVEKLKGDEKERLVGTCGKAEERLKRNWEEAKTVLGETTNLPASFRGLWSLLSCVVGGPQS